MDREKVIKGFEVCLKNIDQPDCPNDCPYLSDCSKYENRVVFQPLMRDALALLKDENEKLTEWIPTASKMPERDQNVLVWLYGNYDIGYWDKDPDTREQRWSFEAFNLYGDEMDAVKAWMPLPKAYNEK